MPCDSPQHSSDRVKHPLAAAVLAGAQERAITIPAVTDFRSVPGKGIVARVDGASAALGNLAMMEEAGVTTDAGRAKADELRREGQTVMFLALDGQLAALLGVADPIKATTIEAITALHAEGLQIVMLTGDNRVTAEAVARQLHIDEIRADVLPAEKRAVVQEFQRAGRIVAMAGDGEHRPWRKPPLASRWAPARTSRSKAPASPSSKATCVASSGRGA